MLYVDGGLGDSPFGIAVEFLSVSFNDAVSH